MNKLEKEIDNLIKNFGINREIIREFSKENKLTLKVNNLLITSKYNIEKENERFFNINYDKEIDYFLIIGFGLGYHIDYFLKNIKNNQKIFVLILNPDIFLEFINSNIEKKFIQSENIELVYGNEEILMKKISNILDNASLKGKLVINSPLFKLSKDYYPKLYDIIDKIMIDKQSLEKDREIVEKNIDANMKIVIESIGVKEYRDKHKNSTIFIISGGPSLNKNINELKNIKNNGVIISVGTVVDVLMKNGIKPDYIVVIDPLLNVYNQLENYLQLEIPLVYIPSVNSKLLNNYSGKKIVAFPDKDSYYSKMEEKYNKGLIQTGGSVATTALDFANQLGATNIVFVGQDLALSSNLNTHATGTLLNKEKTNLNNLIEIESVDGKKIYTLKNLYHYLRWIEKYIGENKNIAYIDATEGGAKIKGTKAVKLKEYILNNLNII